MNKFSYLVLLSIVLSPAFAQKIQYKLRSGYSASNVVINGHKFYKTEYGPNGGMTVETAVKKNFLLEAGLMYSHKGDSYSDKRSQLSTTPNQRFETISYKTSNILHYLIVPVRIGYSLTDKVHFFAGPEISYLLSAPVKLRGVEVTYLDYYRKFDFSATATMEYKPFKSVGIYGGYDYGLSKFMKAILTTSNGDITGYKYVGSNRTIFIGLFYRGEITTKR